MLRSRNTLALTTAAILAAGCVPMLPQPDSGRLKPMPVRPFDVKTSCRYTDEAGYGVRIDLDVVQSEAKAFSAAVSVPGRGSCRFEGPFTQVRRLPSVALRAQDGCTVNIWEQGEQVTVGFSNCARRCTRGTFDYVWPILIDRARGQCH